jgi:hypothetical protein
VFWHASAVAIERNIRFIEKSVHQRPVVGTRVSYGNRRKSSVDMLDRYGSNEYGVSKDLLGFEVEGCLAYK